MRYYKEILLIEGIILSLLWISNDYLASLVTFILVPVIFATLIISWLVEKISKSDIPRSYFSLMLGLTFIPIIFYIIFIFFNDGPITFSTE